MKGALGGLMRQAQEMQKKVQEAQEKLADLSIIGESGAGLVSVELNGRHEARRVTLDPSLMGEDKEIIEDLLAAAINDAVQKVEKASKDNMASITGGLNLPEGFELKL